MSLEQNTAADFRRVIGKYGFNQGMDIEMGSVVNINPLEVLIDGREVVLEKKDFRVAGELVAREETVKIDGITRTITHKGLQQSDRVAFLYDADRSVYFIFATVADEEEY